MNRTERAAAIRAAVMKEMEANGRWERLGDARALMVRAERWSAIMFTPFAPLPGSDSDPPTFLAALAKQRAAPPKPYQIDVWLSPGGKVLSVEWSNSDDLRIISMKRGDWEHELFGLPPK